MNDEKNESRWDSGVVNFVQYHILVYPLPCPPPLPPELSNLMRDEEEERTEILRIRAVC